MRRIITTLAAKLAEQSPKFAAALAAELRADSGAAHRPVSDQIGPLLRRPLAALPASSGTIVFVLDALDECSDQHQLTALLTAISDSKANTGFKFILTSRPEIHIRGTPISNPKLNTVLKLHAISEEEVTADIRLYISATLQAAAPGESWYTENDVETLFRLSQGLFIFASTVILYIRAREHVKGRKERLQKVTSAANAGPSATVTLDKIYEMVIIEASRSDAVDADELSATQRVLACILAARISLSVQALADLLDLDVVDLRGSLERLHSVVHLPEDDVAPGVRALHTSFADYMPLRAVERVRIATSLGGDILTGGCLQIMREKLRFDVSRSQSSYQPNSSTSVETFPLSLEYACLHWIYHIAGLPQPSGLDGEIDAIFRPRFLFWLEVISTLKQVQRGAVMLVFAAATVSHRFHLVTSRSSVPTGKSTRAFALLPRRQLFCRIISRSNRAVPGSYLYLRTAICGKGLTRVQNLHTTLQRPLLRRDSWHRSPWWTHLYDSHRSPG